MKKLEEQSGDGLVLLLLHPVSGAIQKMNGTHLGACLRPHGLDGAGALIRAPITFSRDECRWNVDGAAGKQLKLGGVLGVSIYPIRVQAALESRPAILRTVHAQFFLRQPLACRNRRCGRQLRRDGLRHSLGQIHHVIARKLGHFGGAVGRERERLVVFKVCAFEVIVGAQEIMDALRRVPHILICRPRGVVRLVVLARDRELRKIIIDVSAARSAGFRRIVGRIEWQRGRACKRSAHQYDGPENVGPRQRAPGRNAGAMIVTYHGSHRAIADCRQQPKHVSHFVQNRERLKIVIVCHIRTAAAPVTSKVRCDDMKSRSRERQNHPSPAIGEFRKSMNEQDAWPRWAFESCFQYVISDAIDVVDEARTNARRKCSPAVGYISVSLRCRAYHSRKADRHGRNSLKKLTPRHCFPSSRLPLFVLFYDACATAHQNLYCRSFLNGLVSCWRAGSSTEPKIEPVLRLVVVTIFSDSGLHSEAAIVTPSVSAITASDIGIGI